MALSDPLFTPEALRNLAKDNGPEYAGRSRRALRWCADVIEAADAVVQESAEVRKDDEALLAEARAELQWWIDNHRCCAGHEDDLLDRLDARLEKAP